VRWRASYPAGGGNTPALVGDSLYAVFFDGTFRAISTRDGSLRFAHDVHNTLDATTGQLPTPSIDGCGIAWVYSDDGHLYGFGLGGSAMQPIPISTPRVAHTVAQVAIGADQALYVHATDGRLYALQ
jgi:hypothetical protein